MIGYICLEINKQKKNCIVMKNIIYKHLYDILKSTQNKNHNFSTYYWPHIL